MITLRNLYLAVVSLSGLLLIFFGIGALPTYTPLNIFFLLLLLGVAAQITSTSLIGEDVTVEVSTAVSMATVSLYGPLAACLVAGCAASFVILSTLRRNWPGWPRAIERLGFNLGMVTIAIYGAGFVFELIRDWFGAASVFGIGLAWLLAAIINDQINLWFLIGILQLQNRAKPVEIWRQHRWAIPINVMVMSVGGGILSLAVTRFDIIGIGIFFLPIILSAYAFRLYVNQNKRQMERLEELIAERTNDLRTANQALAELNKTKDAFLAVLTHDMRTPLSSIKGYVGVLSKGNLTSEQQMHAAKILMRSQDSLMEIVNNILEIEKLQSGAPIELYRTEFDLAYLTTLVSETITTQAAEKSINLQFNATPTPIIVNGDREKIKRVIMNLISNAVKYTEEGGTVTVTTQQEGGFGLVNVIDTGLGIPPDELPYIFERFRRVKGHRHLAVGTGLGLAIVKSLVEAHGGQILVESEENVGSTFTMRLPLTLQLSGI